MKKVNLEQYYGLVLVLLTLLIVGSYCLITSCAEQKHQPNIVFCASQDSADSAKMGPVIAELERDGYQVYRPARNEWAIYGVRYAPTTIIYSNGLEIHRFIGFAHPAKLRVYLKKI